MARVAVAPLISRPPTSDTLWVGAVISKLLTEHFMAVDVEAHPYDAVVSQIQNGKHELPLTAESAYKVREELQAEALIHGTYNYDEAGNMLGLRLRVSGADITSAPLEAALPAGSFNRFIERISLALLDRLNIPINDQTRAAIKQVPRPASFEAVQHLARAQQAWAGGEYELALAAVETALARDADLEDAIAIQVAIARDAEDTVAAKEAFDRWIAVARRRNEPELAAERAILLGHWMFERDQWSLARDGYRTAAEIAKRAGHEHMLAHARNNIANLDLLTGKYHQAIAAYRRSVRAFETAGGNTEDAALTYYNLSIAHKGQGQHEEALRALEEALRVASNGTTLQGRCIAQRGAVKDDMGQWANAMADYARAAPLLSDFPAEQAMLRVHQALLYRKQGAYPRAEDILLEALDTLESLEHHQQHAVAIIWLNLADLYFAMDMLDQAWEYVNQAQTVFEDLGSAWQSRATRLITALEETTPPEEDLPPPSDV